MKKQRNENLGKVIFEVCEKPFRHVNIKAMNLKQAAGERAAEFVKDEMTVGLGTGSTVYWTIRRLGGLVIEEKLKIRAVPTSLKTENLARECGIPLVSFADVREVDLTIDGAEEVSPTLDLIKGRGGSIVYIGKGLLPVEAEFWLVPKKRNKK